MTDELHSASLIPRAWRFVATDKRGRTYNFHVSEADIHKFDRYPIPVCVWFRV